MKWKIIHNMHDIEPQIVSEIDIEFVPDKYNKKESNNKFNHR